jgi:hypothetical protein
VLFRRIGPEVVLARVDGEDLESLSETAGAVWGLLDEPRSVDELATALRASYGSDPARIASDVEALLDELVGRGVVERVRDLDG